VHQERGTDPKIIVDQQGHGLAGVHLSEYVDSSLVRKQEAAFALWSDLKALQSAAFRFQLRRKLFWRGMQAIEKVGAGDGTRTRDVQLGKLNVD
jgi:hypothetical protein